MAAVPVRTNRKESQVALIHTTWLSRMGNRATARMGDNVIVVDLIDGITIGAVAGEGAEELGRALIGVGELVLALNGTRRTDQDDLAVQMFVEQESLDPALLPTLRRLVGYVESVRANPYNELVVDELAGALR